MHINDKIVHKKVNNLSYSLHSQLYSHYTNKKTHLGCAFHKLAGVVGVEPTSTVLETVVLPLNYTPKMVREGFEPSNSKEGGFTVRCV